MTRRGHSLLIEFHAWEGFSFDRRRDLFSWAIVLGWISIISAHGRFTDKLADLTRRLHEAVNQVRRERSDTIEHRGKVNRQRGRDGE